MIRPIAIEIALFLTPFALYALFLWATRAGVLHPDAWSTQRVALLSIAALVLMIAGFATVIEFAGGPPDAAYVPPHLENGKLVPGTVK
jgi:Family of unknown function (DUF6111)